MATQAAYAPSTLPILACAPNRLFHTAAVGTTPACGRTSNGRHSGGGHERQQRQLRLHHAWV